MNSLTDKDGNRTTSTNDTLKTLLEAHFQEDSLPQPECSEKEGDDSVIKCILTEKRLKRIISTLPKNKAPGNDNIKNEMITKTWDHIGGPLTHIFYLCLKIGKCPKIWKNSRGIAIAKPNKTDYTNPRAFRIITLTSNLQKLLERAILDYLEKDLKIDKKLTKNQFGFRKKKSTQAAIHKITRKIEDSLANGHFTLGIFLDVEGAFDSIRFRSIKEALEKTKIPETISNWIYNMINDREITITLHGVSLSRKIHKGCPQGGILSPLLWNLTLNTLLDRYDLDRDSIICYADDMAIIISGFDLNATMRLIAIRYLKTIDKWCTANGVKLSATKTQLILFRTKNKKFKLDPIVIRGQTLHLTDEVTYLGVILDKYLSWTPHITAKTIVANKKLKMTKALIGKEWGLEPKALRYIYNDVIFPGISYACFVWQHKCLSNKSIT